MSGHRDTFYRSATPADAEAVALLIDDLRRALGDPLGHLTADVIRRDGFGAVPEFSIIVAERSGRLVGYALFRDAYEPAFAARGTYLADLFVSESARRSGVGRGLLDAVAADNRRRGRTFVWWVTAATNGGAQAFYARLAPRFSSATVSYAMVLD